MYVIKKNKNKKKKKKDNFLEYIPVRKNNVWEVKENKVYIYIEHNKPIERFLDWLVKKPKVTDLELDEVGTEVWLLIDGENSIYNIGVKLKEKLGDKVEPLYERLIMYIGNLSRKNLIYFKKK